jgi:hypothetical protein
VAALLLKPALHLVGECCSCGRPTAQAYAAPCWGVLQLWQPYCSSLRCTVLGSAAVVAAILLKPALHPVGECCSCGSPTAQACAIPCWAVLQLWPPLLIKPAPHPVGECCSCGSPTAQARTAPCQGVLQLWQPYCSSLRCTLLGSAAVVAALLLKPALHPVGECCSCGSPTAQA